MNPINKRIYIKGTITLDSPLIIGSGESANTDIDLIRDWDGKPFIPGTSLAGVSRHFLKEEAAKELFGGKKDDSKISPIVFYDLIPIEKPGGEKKDNIVISVRDGVCIDEYTKTAKDKEKFDYEILEPGSEFSFKLEVVIRKDNDENNFAKVIDSLIQGLMTGNIRCGRKTKRGFGKIILKDVKKLEIDIKTEAKKWLDFNWDSDIWKNSKTIEPIKDDNNLIKAKFKIPGSIIIKHYPSDPKAPDSVHISSRKGSIIPGTSWAGVLRHTALKIGKILEKEDEFKKILDEMFGYTGKTNGKGAPESKASKLIIEESIIKNGKKFDYTRNKIDRFTGGTVDTALFTEQPHYNGETTLEIRFPGKIEAHEIAVLLLALKDIGNGIAPVGGEANIGRGILEINSSFILGNPLDDKLFDDYMKKLNVHLKKGGAKNDSKNKT